MSAQMSYVIGIDVGGTFTDVVCSDGEMTWRAKSPTNPAIFSEGVLEGCRLVGKQIGVSLDGLLASTARFGLGTTAVTNVFASLLGHRVGLLTTSGFESEMQLARGARVSQDGWLALPWNPVDEDCVRGVNERIDRPATYGELRIIPRDIAGLWVRAYHGTIDKQLHRHAVIGESNMCPLVERNNERNRRSYNGLPATCFDHASKLSRIELGK